MSNIVVTIFGNLVDDPRYLQTNGGPLTKFRVANTARRQQRDGAWVDGDTTYYDVTCWRQLAVHAAGSLAKGDPVVVHGRITMRDWATETKSGRDVEINADHLGHNLRFGTSLFRKPNRAPVGADAVGADAAAAEEVGSAAEVPLPDEPPATEDPFAA
jgi:single-strand DNA-binding protein